MQESRAQMIVSGGICGVRGRGNDHIHGFSGVPGTEIAALCDVDETCRTIASETREAGIAKAQILVDVRKLLEDKILMPFSIAAPNHARARWPSGRARPEKMCM